MITPQSEPTPLPPSNRLTKILLILLIVWPISLIWAFLGGYLTNTTTSSLPQPTITPTDRPAITPRPDAPTTATNPQFSLFSYPTIDQTNYYFDDTLTAITDTNPPRLIVATYVRSQSGNQYLHNARATFYDGTTWHRNTDTLTSPEPNPLPNSVINSLDIYQATDRVLRQRLDTTLTINSANIALTTNTFDNDITLRTEPTLSRIISDTTGTLSIDNQPFPARVMYAKWYSLDQSKLNFYSSQLGIETKVIDLWIKDGSSLHLDLTQVDHPTDLYQSHALASFKSATGQITKTFDFTLTTDSAAPPQSWIIDLGPALNLTAQLTTTTHMDRAEGPEYNWQRGILAGPVTINGQTHDAFGTFEYILEKN